ncbi:hypothetical protein [Streptosporangium lutulentum]|uniref:Uncharacterized protein n=1 Tax=Streptosporangium lutulentum TaxID=1461250 RepID=A0ABT9QVL6_9ACTN|nr:hypothetical protein [Streptosporangium lutulentum]MDP9850338.1 hypothetical protein [Streptosporangium lutulentum]
MTSSARSLPPLLSAAATLLQRVGELLPVSVTCQLTHPSLAPVTLTPASLHMSRDDQHAVVKAIATALGWSCRRLPNVDGGWVADGRIDGIPVEALAAPITWTSTSGERAVRGTGITTADHAALLLDLVDWSAALPTHGIAGLEVREDLDAGALRACLVVADRATTKEIGELVLAAPDDGWSGYAGAGLLPTGHDLSVSVGRY